MMRFAKVVGVVQKPRTSWLYVPNGPKTPTLTILCPLAFASLLIIETRRAGGLRILDNNLVVLKRQADAIVSIRDIQVG
jgi:hypothetical protein